ncbi:MAG: helix-turn-helix transcriptional regulator [Clostridia bacterium]|nr:helix-turn-helix transcriptional regulator [Clostridia bacterium]
MNWEAVGKRIRRQREFLGYSREALAERIDVTPKFCSDIELGIKGMSVPTLCRLTRVLNLSADYILFGDEERGETPVIQMIRRCPGEAEPHLETIVKTFLQAVEKNDNKNS